MKTRVLFAVGLACLVLGVTPSEARQGILALEGGHFDLSAHASGESPPGSGILHDVSVDSGDPAFGLTFEGRLMRHLGVRVGFLRSSIAVRGRSLCSDSPCTFRSGNATLTLDEIDWSVDENSHLHMFFVEIPVVFEPYYDVEVFLGPTVADVEIGDAESTGPNGLRISTGTSSPTVGLHAGATYSFGRRRGPGATEPKWSVGAIVRWIPTRLDLTVDGTPVGTAGEGIFRAKRDADLLSISVTVGRRFGSPIR